MNPRPWALMRPVSHSIADCELSYQPRRPIDCQRARRQHRAYAERLRQSGVDVHELDEAPGHPDACFLEDTAVVLGSVAVVCRLGAPSRRGETPPVRSFLRQRGYDLVEMDPPATADGGDVLAVDDHLFIGLSARTNRQGAAVIADAAIAAGWSPHTIAVAGALHLKTVCTYAGNGLLIADVDKLGEGRGALRRWTIYSPPADEVGATNVRPLGNRVFVPADCPVTLQRIEAAGLVPIEIDVSELQKAEAGLTCLVLAPQ